MSVRRDPGLFESKRSKNVNDRNLSLSVGCEESNVDSINVLIALLILQSYRVQSVQIHTYVMRRECADI